MKVTKENFFSRVEMTSERAEEGVWEVTIKFDNRLKHFIYKSDEDPKENTTGVIQQLLCVHEDFGGPPSYKSYKNAYFGESAQDDEVRSIYERDITNYYEPALELFGDHVDEVYDVCLEYNMPRIISMITGVKNVLK